MKVISLIAASLTFIFISLGMITKKDSTKSQQELKSLREKIKSLKYTSDSLYQQNAVKVKHLEIKYHEVKEKSKNIPTWNQLVESLESDIF